MSIESEFNAARQAVLNGENLSLEKMRDLVAALRANRHAAAEAGNSAKSKRTAAKKETIGISDQDLDSALGDLGL